MKTNIEILKEYCSAHTCVWCPFNERIGCSLTQRVREGFSEIMDMVRRDCEVNGDVLYSTSDCEVKSDILYSTTDIELEEELGKD